MPPLKRVMNRIDTRESDADVVHSERLYTLKLPSGVFPPAPDEIGISLIRAPDGSYT